MGPSFPPVEEQLDLIERGAVEVFPREELVDKLKKSRASGKPLRVKFGIDPTSADIHIGHAVTIRKLKHFQELGHQVVVIIGDYTAMVGDPSGRDKTRPQLAHDEVLVHAQTYLEQVGKILDMDRTEVVHNGDWFAQMSFNDVVRLTAKMTVAQLLERDDFGKRYAEGSPVSVHEFLYPLMQGYDSVMVRSDVEIGATEQTFNLTVGRDFQRDAGQDPQVCLTLPILVGTDGVKKMSKSLGNTIGISEAPTDMYGKAMSIPDDLIMDYFELATEVPLDEARALLDADGPMPAKMRLATELVRMYHDAAAADDAAEHFDKTVRRKQTPEEIPEIAVTDDLLKDGQVWIVKLIVHCGFASSNGEARRLIAQGGVSIDDEPIDDANLDFEPEDGMVLKVGKRNFACLRL